MHELIVRSDDDMAELAASTSLSEPCIDTAAHARRLKCDPYDLFLAERKARHSLAGSFTLDAFSNAFARGAISSALSERDIAVDDDVIDEFHDRALDAHKAYERILSDNEIVRVVESCDVDAICNLFEVDFVPVSGAEEFVSDQEDAVIDALNASEGEPVSKVASNVCGESISRVNVVARDMLEESLARFFAEGYEPVIAAFEGYAIEVEDKVRDIASDYYDERFSARL